MAVWYVVVLGRSMVIVWPLASWRVMVEPSMAVDRAAEADAAAGAPGGAAAQAARRERTPGAEARAEAAAGEVAVGAGASAGRRRGGDAPRREGDAGGGDQHGQPKEVGPQPARGRLRLDRGQDQRRGAGSARAAATSAPAGGVGSVGRGVRGSVTVGSPYSYRRATMGSRRAAWRAGQTPKTTPTTRLKATATTTVRGLKAKPQPATWPMTAEAMTPSSDPDHAAQQRDDEGFHEELGQDVPAARPDGLADADLAGPLADRDQHDVHDPDAAHDQRDRGDPAEQHGEQPADGADGAQQLRLVGDAEVGRPAGADAVALVEGRRDRRLDRVDLVGRGDAQADRPHARAADEVVLGRRQAGSAPGRPGWSDRRCPWSGGCPRPGRAGRRS